VWDFEEDEVQSPAAAFSVSAAPLPRPPADWLQRPLYQAKLQLLAPHFETRSTIRVNRLSHMLKSLDHPNPIFVESVVLSLRDGFWPPMKSLPDAVVELDNHGTCAMQPDKLRELRDTELAQGRFAGPFATNPGLLVNPLGLVPKPRSDKLRLITDQSAGRPSLNDRIDKDRCRVSYDSLHHFAPSLVGAHRRHAVEGLVVWKSDAKAAFRHLKMHPLFALLQVYKIDGAYYMDNFACFGSSFSPLAWTATFSCVLWIYQSMYNETIYSLMDDSWGVTRAADVIAFRDRRVPLAQAKFLELLDFLGFEWEWPKQLHGAVLEVIGFEVDSRTLAFRLAGDRKAELVAALRDFGSVPRRPLVEWQRMAGWANWALNVFPLGRWSLQSTYAKLRGKTIRNASITVSKAVKADLNWLADGLEASSGRFFLAGQLWTPGETDNWVWTDACPRGIAFYAASIGRVHYATLPLWSDGRPFDIFYAETLGIICAIDFAIARRWRRLLVLTDSMDAVHLFSSHAPNDLLRPLFKHAILAMTRAGLDVKVQHIPGKSNVVADAASRGLLDTARQYAPHAAFYKFYPPSTLLGGPSK
jgi:hypothetical protein